MKVLLADDDPTLRLLMRELLTSELRHEVHEANDGLSAWEALDLGFEPDLSILDLRMPRLGGLDLAARMRGDRRYAHQKIMICSTVNQKTEILRAAALRINAYLLKPFLAMDFVEKVKRLCASAGLKTQPAPLQPLRDALTRVGGDRQNYVRLLRVFTGDVEEFAWEMRDWRPGTGRTELEFRLGAIRGAGRSLGADALVAAAACVEWAMTRSDIKAVQLWVGMLEQENERVKAATKELEKKD